MTSHKKPARKETVIDRARSAYQRGFDERNDPDKRMRAAESRKPAAKKASRQFGEPAEMSEAQKARIRANRAAAKKGK